MRAPKHGTSSEYKNYHCRCRACKNANSRAQVEYVSKRGRFAGTCRFDTCAKKALKYQRHLCYGHYALFCRMVTQKRRTWEELELACIE